MMTYHAEPSLPPCWAGDFRRWNPSGTNYQNQMFCDKWKVYINPSGLTCRLCAQGKWPEAEAAKAPGLPVGALLAAPALATATAEQTFESARAAAISEYEWVRPLDADGRNGVRAWQLPTCVFRGEVVFATLHGCCDGQRVEEEFSCAKTGADVLAISCLRCPLREESVLAGAKAKIVTTGNTTKDTKDTKGTKDTKDGNGEKNDLPAAGVVAHEMAAHETQQTLLSTLETQNGLGTTPKPQNPKLQAPAASRVSGGFPLLDPPRSPAPFSHNPRLPSLNLDPLSVLRASAPPREPAVAVVPNPPSFVPFVVNPPVPFRVSAILPARDEGADVAATAASFLAAGVDEIVVVDDASRDGSCAPGAFAALGCSVVQESPPSASSAPPREPAVIRVLRNEQPQGCALCRNQGGAAATGDVIIFADAHMRAESSLRDFALSAYQRNTILNAAVKPLDGQHNTTVYGARIAQDKDSPAYRMAHIVRRPDRASRFAPIPGLHGACYAIPRPVWDRLGGWVPNVGWGYNEQALSMKAFFLAISLESDAETVVRHRYRKQFPYVTALSLTQLNRFITHRLLFSDRVWRRHWLPLFAKAWPDQAAQWAKLDRSRHYWKLRDNFRKQKVRTDEEFFEHAVSR